MKWFDSVQLLENVRLMMRMWLFEILLALSAFAADETRVTASGEPLRQYEQPLPSGMVNISSGKPQTCATVFFQRFAVNLPDGPIPVGMAVTIHLWMSDDGQDAMGKSFVGKEGSIHYGVVRSYERTTRTETVGEGVKISTEPLYTVDFYVAEDDPEAPEVRFKDGLGQIQTRPGKTYRYVATYQFWKSNLDVVNQQTVLDSLVENGLPITFMYECAELNRH